MDPRGLRSAPNNRNRFHLNDASSLLVMCLLWCSVYRPTYTIYRSSSSLNVCSKACLYKAAFLKQNPKGNRPKWEKNTFVHLSTPCWLARFKWFCHRCIREDLEVIPWKFYLNVFLDSVRLWKYLEPTSLQFNSGRTTSLLINVYLQMVYINYLFTLLLLYIYICIYLSIFNVTTIDY